MNEKELKQQEWMKEQWFFFFLPIQIPTRNFVKKGYWLVLGDVINMIWKEEYVKKLLYCVCVFLKKLFYPQPLVFKIQIELKNKFICHLSLTFAKKKMFKKFKSFVSDSVKKVDNKLNDSKAKGEKDLEKESVYFRNVLFFFTAKSYSLFLLKRTDSTNCCS